MPHQSQPSRGLLTRLAIAVGLASTAIAAAVVPTSGVPANAATVGVLCSGFAACDDAGMSSQGYHDVWDTMFWNMYAGKNCTNYVAFRMIRAGMPSTRPTQLKAGQGNASFWGASFGTLTTKVPTVGSVAWWNANVPGAGSGGHVAYVERVNSPTDITVSESNWSGNFDWRRITTAANWPSGFIHLHDSGTPVVTPTPTPTSSPSPTASPTDSPTASPTTSPTSSPSASPIPGTLSNTAPPTIVGTVAVGQTLTAAPGTWTQADLTYAYQWYVGGVAVAGETASTFDVGRSRLGKTISVEVTARGAGVEVAAASAATAPVQAGTIGVTTPPQITGTPQLGQTLTAVPPVTTKALTSTDVQWYADSQPIPGATTWSLALTSAEATKSVTVQVHGRRVAFNDVVTTSSPAGPVPIAAQLTAKAVAGRRSAVVKVKVKALGHFVADGTVTATIGKHVVTRHVRGAKLVLHLTGLHTGRRTLKIQYAGTPRYLGVSEKQQLQIR